MIELSCERCNKALPGPDPLRRAIHPDEVRRFDGTHQPARPVRVVKLGLDGEPRILYWCSSRHYKADHRKPAKKTPKGKLKPDQQSHITHHPPAAA